MAGDADANARRTYVIRRESTTATAEPATRPEAPPGEGLVIPPPEEENGTSRGGFASFVGFAPPEGQTSAPGNPRQRRNSRT